jgi:hypothetical protein
MRLVLIASLFAATLLAAPDANALGANSDSNLKAHMAQRVMEDTHRLVEPEQITLINVRRGMFRVTWQADTPNGRYACTADDMMRNPSCTRIEVEEAPAQPAN